MGRIVLKAGRVLCGSELEPMTDGAVIVENGEIQGIVAQRDLKAEADEEVIDLGALTLMPGMIECHNHLCIDATIPDHLELLAGATECELTVLAQHGLLADLMSGVTTARCMADLHDIDISMKKLIEAGKVTGPRLLVSGVGIKGSHGAGYIGIPHCGPEDVRKTVRQNLKKGVDLIKLFITPGVPDPNSEFVPSFLSPEEIRMAVEEAKRKGVSVSAHCIGGQGLIDCIENGVKIIEHVYMITDEEVKRLEASDCIVDLTSGIMLDPSREAFLSEANAKKVRLNRERVRKNVARVINSKVPYILGTDAYHGFLYRECVYAVELGADERTAVKAVTSFAAKALNQDQKIGSLASGLLADVIAVDGNPLEDIQALSRVKFVMKDGIVYKN